MKNFFNKYKFEILLTVGAVVFLVLSRTVLHIQNNIEFITGFTLAFSYFFKNIKLAVVVTIVTLIMSDLIIGNTNIVIFTWSGFLMNIVIGRILRSTNGNPVLKSEIGGIAGTLFFFFWTNFGVVALSSMYSKDFSGLIQSYHNGLPFLTNQLIGNIIIVPAVFVAFRYLLASNRHQIAISDKIT